MKMQKLTDFWPTTKIAVCEQCNDQLFFAEYDIIRQLGMIQRFPFVFTPLSMRLINSTMQPLFAKISIYSSLHLFHVAISFRILDGFLHLQPRLLAPQSGN